MTTDAAPESKKRLAAALTIDAAEPPETRLQRLIEESPVVIFSRSSCCMCHVMKRLLAAVGAHPTVIELDEAEDPAAAPAAVMPAMFIGGEPVGGIEGLMALHLSGRLVPRLREETEQVAEKITWREAGLPAGAYGITYSVFGISAIRAGKSTETETKETEQVAEKITWMEAGLPAGAYGITYSVFMISATRAGKSTETETKVQRDQGLHIFED